MNFAIADDHGIFRSGLKLILRDLYPDCDIREAAQGDEVLKILEQSDDLELLLLDLRMPESSGVSLLQQCREQYPEVPCMVVSASEELAVMQSALQSGAIGYIPKSSSNAEIADAIQKVLSGDVYIPPQLQSIKRGDHTLNVNLTPRQLEVLGLLSEGMSNKQIGSELHIAPGTIKAHIAAIFRELESVNRTQAVRRARELHLL